MPRPCKTRRIAAMPLVTFFKPQGVPMDSLRGAVLPVEGLEALRLADFEGLDHDQAALGMGVSRPTFSRLLNEARHIVATALVKGWALRIDGGDYQVAEADESREPRRRRCRQRRGGE